jgi:hypothetical protein
MRRPGGRWTNRDRVLAAGLVHYERSLNAHGIPSWIAQDGDQRFGVDEVMDHAARLVETTQADYASNENADTHGLRVVVAHLGPRSASS